MKILRNSVNFFQPRKSDTKPSPIQTEKCKQILSDTDSIFCGDCFKENDVNYINHNSQIV